MNPTRIEEDLQSAVFLGLYVPSDDETHDIASSMSSLLVDFHTHVETARDKSQADLALLEIGVAIAGAVGLSALDPRWRHDRGFSWPLLEKYATRLLANDVKEP